MDITVKLDINKAGQFTNEPVTMRTGESDNVIKASVFKDGTPYTGFKTATFNTTRSSGAVIANDPATVSGNTVSYSVAPTVTNNIGKLRNSYFLLDGKTSTESFEVAILPGVSADGDITDYVPGLSGLQDKWAKVSADWDTKIDGIKKEIENVSISDELKTAMNAAIDEAKAEYMATFNEAVKSIDDTAKSLQDKQTVAASELDKTIADAKAKGNSAADSVDSNIKSLNDKSKDIDTAVADVNSKIADVDGFLTSVQASITAANSKFTSDQEAAVNKVLDELKAEVANAKTDADDLSKRISDIKTAVDSFDMPQVTADTKKALETAKSANSKIDALKDQLDLATQNISGVRTNLLLDSKTQMRQPSWPLNNSNWSQNWGTYLGSNIYRATNAWNNIRYGYKDLLDRGVINTTDDFTYSVYFRVVGEDPAGMSYADIRFYSTATTKNSLIPLKLTSLKEGQWVRMVVPFKFTGAKYDPTKDYDNSMRLEMSAAPKVDGAHYEFAAPKLEKGPTATDYSLNPEDIVTDGNVQTSIKNALGNYPTSSEVDSKISTGVGQAKTYAEQTIKGIIGAAPETLDTIAELADAVTENKDGVQAINEGITKKADKTDVTALQNTVQTIITSISQEDYDALVSAGTVNPKIMYVIPDA